MSGPILSRPWPRAPRKSTVAVLHRLLEAPCTVSQSESIWENAGEAFRSPDFVSIAFWVAAPDPFFHLFSLAPVRLPAPVSSGLLQRLPSLPTQGRLRSMSTRELGSAVTFPVSSADCAHLRIHL